MQNFTEKYRPSNFSELSGHEQIVNSVQELIKSQKISHLLFHGAPGLGKTSCALLIAKTLYGEDYMRKKKIISLNASDQRGIDVVREELKEFITTDTFAFNKIEISKKLIILDEMDGMTNEAQNALRRILEKYNSVCFFILIVNEIDRVDLALRSRCINFFFSPLTSKQITHKINEIIKNESLIVVDEKNHEDSIHSVLISIYEGDLRKIIACLETIKNMYESQLSVTNLYKIARQPAPHDIAEIVQVLTEQAKVKSVTFISSYLTNQGLHLSSLLHPILNFILQHRKNFDMQKLICGLANVEWYLSQKGSEKIQLAYLAALFQESKKKIFRYFVHMAILFFHT